MYDWNQTKTTVTISIPISYNIDEKKIDSLITENYIKLNIPEMKIIKYLDLLDTIDIDNSKMILEDKKVIFYLIKVNEIQWKELEYKTGNKDELKQRRKQADENYQLKIQKEREAAEKKKKEFSKFVVDQSIKIDDEKRNELKEKQTQERVEAEKELYKFVEKIEKEKGGKEEKEEEEEVKENEKEIETTNARMEGKELTPGREEKVLVKKVKEPAQIRQPASIRVNLTEKIIPHFAARESLSKEPPYPKSKKYVPEKNYLGHEIDDRNPIWAKEKADNLFKNHDYISAINTYNTALELDPIFHKCLLNRATCFIHLGEFSLAQKDLQTLQDQITSLDSKEKEDPFYERIYNKSLAKMYAIHTFMNNFPMALDIINNKLLTKANCFPFLIDEKMWSKIQKDKEMIEIRLHNEEFKIQADELLLNKNFSQAKDIYLSILESEPNNEKILSNLSLIYINEEDYNNSIKCCSNILKILRAFGEKIRMRKFDHSFEIKILLRRAKCYEKLGEMSKAQEDIESIDKLEIRNDTILKDIKEIKDSIKLRVVENYKNTANSYLEKGQFSEALDLYTKALGLIKYGSIFNKFDLVKIMLNRSSCLIKLNQFDNALEECSKILVILSKQKSIALINSNLDQIEQIKNLEFVTYVKRAFTYTSNGKIEEAIKDYSESLKIKPDDMKIKENLARLRASISQTK